MNFFTRLSPLFSMELPSFFFWCSMQEHIAMETCGIMFCTSSSLCGRPDHALKKNIFFLLLRFITFYLVLMVGGDFWGVCVCVIIFDCCKQVETFSTFLMIHFVMILFSECPFVFCRLMNSIYKLLEGKIADDERRCWQWRCWQASQVNRQSLLTPEVIDQMLPLLAQWWAGSGSSSALSSLQVSSSSLSHSSFSKTVEGEGGTVGAGRQAEKCVPSQFPAWQLPLASWKDRPREGSTVWAQYPKPYPATNGFQTRASHNQT